MSFLLVNMEIAAFKRADLRDCSASVDPCNGNLTVTFKLESINLIVHSFNRFEIHKLKLQIGSKLKMQYLLDHVPSSIKFGSSINDIQGAIMLASMQL